MNYAHVTGKKEKKFLPLKCIKMENTTINETLEGLVNTINYSSIIPQPLVEMATKETRYLKDLKINISNALKYETLSAKESALLALSVAINEKTKHLEKAL